MMIAAGFLAGGLARRMGGGDKAEIKLGQKTLLAWQLAATTHIDCRLINANGSAANGSADRFAGYGLPVIGDKLSGFLGPLAGIHALLCHLEAQHSQITHLLSLATDAPFIPQTLSAELANALVSSGADIAVAASSGRCHPVFALWPVSIRPALEDALINENMRKIDAFTARYKTEIVDFTKKHDIGEPDPFLNINRPEDLHAAEALLAAKH